MQASTSSNGVQGSRTGILKRPAEPAQTDDVLEDFFPEEDVDEREAATVLEQARAAEEAAIGASSGEDNGDFYEDPHGAMYSGPLATSVPTSITHMRRRSRSRSRVDRSDIDSDAASGVPLARSARSGSGKKHGRRSSVSSRLRRRDSQSSARSNGTGVARGSFKDRPIPSTAIESASSSGSEDEEGGKKPKKRGMLSAWFGTGKGPARPSLERAGSSASIISREATRSSRSAKRRRGHRRRSSSFGNQRAEHSEHEVQDDEESDINEDDPYGLYGSSSSSLNTTSSSASGSTASSDDARSHRRRHRRGTGGASMFLPSFGGSDPVFGEGGEAEGAISGEDGEESDEDEPFFIDEITAFRQTIYIADEDLQILFQGWGEKTYKTILWTAGVILSFGILSLIGKWIPDWWLSGRGKQREFGRASKIVVKTSHGTTYVVPIKKMTFANPVAISTVFPPTSEPPPTSRNEAMEDDDEEDIRAVSQSDSNAATDGHSQSKPSSATATPVHHTDINGNIPHLSSTSNGTHTPADQGSLKSGKEAKLKEFKYVDFRYYRFLLHPVSGNFHMNR